jgi:hypothetical protein
LLLLLLKLLLLLRLLKVMFSRELRCHQRPSVLRRVLHLYPKKVSPLRCSET